MAAAARDPGAASGVLAHHDYSDRLLSGGQRTQQRDQTPHPVAEVLDRDALVDAVDGLLVVLAQHEGDEAVARDPVIPEVVTVREARDHTRNDGRAAEVGGGELADRP